MASAPPRLAPLAASGGAFTADDITFSVRTMLDENAHALPGSLAALKSIAKEIAVVREGLARSEPPPDKLHRTIKACLMASSGAARDAMLAALELDLGVRITAIAEKKAAPKSITDSSAAGARGSDPVLKAIGVDGLDRALWEYTTRPVQLRSPCMVSAHTCRLGQTPTSVSCMRVWLSSLTLVSYNLQSTCIRRRLYATLL